MMQLDPETNKRNEESQKEIQKQFRDKQDKYAYYQIALCVAAIAFSVNSSINLKLNYYQIPLGLSVISWAISIVYGFTFIESYLHMLFLNNQYLDIITGKHPKTGLNPEKIEFGAKTMMDIIESSSNKGVKFGRNQKKSLYLGMIFFLAWCIIKMANNC